MPSHVHQADYDRLENELANLRAENARLREGLEKFQSWMKSPTQAGLKSLCLSIDAALKEPGV